MKSFMRHLAGWIAALAVTQAFAIPTNIGGFLNAQGNDRHLPVEEWFRDAKHWLAGSDLPGSWSASVSDASRLSLEYPGAIFGISARSVIVVRDVTGAMKEVIASYDEATSKKTRAALIPALQRNIGVFTGAMAKKQADGSQTFDFAGASLTITLSSNGGVTARMVRS